MASMVFDQSVHPRKIGTQDAQGRHLVFGDEAAIAFDISVKDGGELTLYPVRFHEMLLKRVSNLEGTWHCEQPWARKQSLHSLSEDEMELGEHEAARLVTPRAFLDQLP
jgi:hypothetical protein